jgi:hypothetical protein
MGVDWKNYDGKFHIPNANMRAAVGVLRQESFNKWFNLFILYNQYKKEV